MIDRNLNLNRNRNRNRKFPITNQNYHWNKDESDRIGDENVVSGVGRVFPEFGCNDHWQHDLLRHVRVVVKVVRRHVDGLHFGSEMFVNC